MRSAGCCRECQASSDHDPTSLVSCRARSLVTRQHRRLLELRTPLLKDRPGTQLLELGLGYRTRITRRRGRQFLQGRPVVSTGEPAALASVRPARRARNEHRRTVLPARSNQFIVPCPNLAMRTARPAQDPIAHRWKHSALHRACRCAAAELRFRTAPGRRHRVAIRSSSRNRRTPTPSDSPLLRCSDNSRFATCSCPWTGTRSRSQMASDAGIPSRPSRAASTRSTTRATTTAMSTAASSPATPLPAISSRRSSIATSSTRDGGVDVQFDWGFTAGPGKLGLNALLTYVDHWTYLDPSGSAIDYAGTVAAVASDVHCRAGSRCSTFPMRSDELSLTTRWQHIDGHVTSSTVISSACYDYVDVGASYAFKAGPFTECTHAWASKRP